MVAESEISEYTLYGRRLDTPQEEKSPEEREKKSESRVIVLSGPTASGKSAFAVRLAKELEGEIISADSMQIFRGMDIATAKPTSEERVEVAHHLIDVCDVTDTFSVVDFYCAARAACQDILARERVPIVVGGTGFYIHAFLYGPPEGPPSVPKVRKALEQELEELGAETMYQRLQELDPIYARSITARDRHKIVRALEIIQLTEGKVSDLDWQAKTQPLDYDFLCWFLHRPRPALYHRIDKRCEAMVEAGLIEETKHLVALGLRQNSPASNSIGYRQCLEYLETAQGEEDFTLFMERFKQATRRYAKRQLTWFRKENLFRWLDIEAHDVETALQMVLKDYHSSQE